MKNKKEYLIKCKKSLDNLFNEMTMNSLRLTAMYMAQTILINNAYFVRPIKMMSLPELNHRKEMINNSLLRYRTQLKEEPENGLLKEEIKNLVNQRRRVNYHLRKKKATRPEN